MGKVKFGLSNVHIAPITAVSDGVYSYGTVFTIPGAVNLTLDPEGEETNFYADNIKYFNVYANQGYSGTLEMALFNNDFREKILKEVKDSNGAYVENADSTPIGFAFGFQIESDTTGRRFWYYNCTAARPGNASATIETSKEPQTETLNITVAPRLGDHNVRVFMDKTDDNSTAYNGFFDSVYESSISG